MPKIVLSPFPNLHSPYQTIFSLNPKLREVQTKAGNHLNAKPEFLSIKIRAKNLTDFVDRPLISGKAHLD